MIQQKTDKNIEHEIKMLTSALESTFNWWLKRNNVKHQDKLQSCFRMALNLGRLSEQKRLHEQRND